MDKQRKKIMAIRIRIAVHTFLFSIFIIAGLFLLFSEKYNYFAKVKQNFWEAYNDAYSLKINNVLGSDEMITTDILTQQEVINYLNEIEQYKKNINNIINLKNEALESFQNGLDKQESYIEKLNVYNVHLDENIDKILMVRVPKPCEKYHKGIINSYENFHNGIEIEVKYLKFRCNELKTAYNSKFYQADIEIKESDNELNKIFETYSVN